MPPPLPQLLTPSLLRTLRGTPNLAPHTWYCAAGVALSALNRPDQIPEVLKFELAQRSANGSSGFANPPASSPASSPAKLSTGSPTSPSTSSTTREHVAPNAPNITSSGVDAEQLRVARRLREALIKSAVISGLPKAINALLALKSGTPEHLLDAPLAVSPTGRPVDVYDRPASAILHRGQHFFDQIYGKVSKRVMGQMDRSGTEDLGLTARLMYGYILSTTAVLSEAESSLVLVAGLIPLDVNPQLKGHLKGALNNGATVEQVRAVRELTIQLCEATGMTRLPENDTSGWGWRTDVADL